MSFVYSHPFTGLANGLNTINAAGGGAVGGWVELGRTTLGTAGTSLSVSSLPDKRYYMYLWSFIRNTADNDPKQRFNSDSGSNYAYRGSINGASDVTATSQSTNDHSVSNTSPMTFGVHYVVNKSSNEKLSIGNINGSVASGAGTAPSRRERYCKWANTSNAIDEIDVYTAANNVATGSECVVLGWDPADTHTNNFWEELADDTLSGTSSTLDSGTITGKKYLWIQCYITNLSTSLQPLFTFNSDTGNNYSIRYSDNGGADGTATSTSNLGSTAAEGTPQFCNIFIINNTSNEKLAICHGMGQNTASAANAPARRESVWKWANTSNQITKITATTSTGTFGADSVLKVWGAD